VLHEFGEAMRKSQWIELFREGRATYTIILNLSIALHAIDVFVISSVMPTVVQDIGGAAFYAWSTMLYMVASIAGAASGGPIKATLGSRKGYALGGVLFLIGSAGCAASPTMAVLLVARTIQGYGGGLLLAQSMALISALYPTELRTRILALVSGVWGVAAVIGPMVGGIFAEIQWWRGAFWVTVPIIASFTALAWLSLPAGDAQGRTQHFPIRRIALLTFGVMCAGVTGNLEFLGTEHLSLMLIGQLVLLVLAVAAVMRTFHLDAEADNRLFPPRPLSLLAPVGTAYWILFLFSITHTAVSIFLPLALQVLHGATPLVASYAVAPLALAWTLASFVTSGWRGPWETLAIIGGPALSALGMAGLTWGVTDAAPLAASYILAGVIGFGIGACNLHVAALTMRLAERGHESLTASSISTIRALGISFGAAIAGLIANSAGLGEGVTVDHVRNAVVWVYGATILAPAVATLLALRLARLRIAPAPAE
jgi:hypothetical protein